MLTDHFWYFAQTFAKNKLSALVFLSELCLELCYLMFTAVLSATVELVDKQLVILVHWLLLGGSPLARQNPNISLSESGNTLVQLRASSKPECGVAESKSEILNLV